MVTTVDVVIPTHGGWPVTERCLEHLRRQTIPHRVVVVDDVSPDDTVARIRAGHPEVDLVALGENVGFARACNRGIREGTGDVVVLMNNDVEPAPEMLERLVAPFAADARLGSAAPVLLKPDGRIDAVGVFADPTLACFPRLEGEDPAAVDAGGSGTRMLGPHGATAAYRRAALDEVGLLDEGLFMYAEDFDLALRLRGAGWPTTVVPDARGVHLGGASVGLGSARQRFHGGFGRGYVLRTYGVLRSRRGPRALLVELVVCAGDAVLSRDLAALRGRWRGWRAARGVVRRTTDDAAIASEVGLVRSLRLRVGSR